ncbi:MAG: ABC transporter ATP-binding protein [Euryarchaeota archaeon]|nr:ABC transporter ATP-binding protein [Euryarchaeota archaeon]
MGKVAIEDVNRVFEREDTEPTVALENINIEIKEKEFICLVGPSGCGKTTLLRIIAGLDQASSGAVILNNDVITAPSPKHGMVFQEYSLFPWRTVSENITFGPEMQDIPKDEQKKVADYYLKIVGLEQFRNAYPHELSGGMRQRVAIARALANDPTVLLMDEPFGALDAQTRNVMQKELLEIWEKTQKTIIFVTHSVDEAVYLADRIIVMTPSPGRVTEDIRVEMKRPRDRTNTEFAELRRHVLRLMQ